MITPDSKDYQDGVQFLREMHKVVLHNCAELEKLLTDAESRGVFASFAANPEWDSLFQFFLKDAPHHEHDEERFLFPLVVAKVPRVGFQQPNAPIRFLIEGHDVLIRDTAQLVRDWEVFRNTPRDPATLAEAHAKHAAEDAAFIALGRELVALYRDHIATEEERVFSVAEKVLSGEEKLQLMDQLRSEYDNEATTTTLEFDRPQFSDPKYNVQVAWTEARGDKARDAEFEDEG